MKEIGVGIRIDPDEGLSFSGIEQVNGLINRGGKVVSIEPGGALMRKIGEEGESVSLTLTGCEMKVIVDDSDVASSEKTAEHDRLYREGSDLISPYMQLVNRDSMSAEQQTAQQELNRGIELLQQAIAIDPSNWPAHWIVGKAYQALEDSESACDAFEKSFGLHKENADVAREFMFECLKLGRSKKGILAARHAVRLEPENAGLVSNLALALLVGAQLDEASETVVKALEMAPEDEITLNLKKMISEVQSGLIPQPSKLADLNAT